MTNPATDAAAAPLLFDVTEFHSRSVDAGVIERVPLDEIQLAPNPRKEMSPEGVARLAHMMMARSQLVPCIGRRDNQRVILYDGQRRLAAARASRELAASEGYEGLRPLQSLIVLLVDHEPSADEIRVLQAQANAREELTRTDRQEQFRDCWQAHPGLDHDERLAAVCFDLGISAKHAHNLRRELTLPEAIRARVSERPNAQQLGVGMATRLADMHAVAPQLTEAVAGRITSRDLHDAALRDMASFVHRTVIEDEAVYAVRIDDGALLDAHHVVEAARAHLTTKDRRAQVEGLLGCRADQLERELDTLSARAKRRALKVRVDGVLRDRATNGHYAYTVKRGEDFAAGVWVVDPTFLLGEVIDRAGRPEDDEAPAREESYFHGAKPQDDEDTEQALQAERQRRAQERERQQRAAAANTGLGMDIRAGLMDPTDRQLHALKATVCHLLCAQYADVIAYGAGWSDPERQQPVGDTGRHEPRQPHAITAAELQRALEDPDPLRGIAQLVARLGAAFMLDPDGVTKTKALGSERMARKLRDALPGGDHPLRQAIWQFMRPMLSPHLVERNHDAFVSDEGMASSVDLPAHRGESSLDGLDLGDDEPTDAPKQRRPNTPPRPDGRATRSRARPPAGRGAHPIERRTP